MLAVDVGSVSGVCMIVHALRCQICPASERSHVVNERIDWQRSWQDGELGSYTYLLYLVYGIQNICKQISRQAQPVLCTLEQHQLHVQRAERRRHCASSAQ